MLNECFCDFASFKIPRLELNWSSWDLMWLKFTCLSHIRIQEEDKQKLDQSRGNYNQITQLILYCLVLQWDYTCNIQGVSLKWQQVNWTSSPSSLKWSYLSYMHLFANLQWYLWHLNIQTWKLKNGCHPNMGLYICISHFFEFVFFLYLYFCICISLVSDNIASWDLDSGSVSPCQPIETCTLPMQTRSITTLHGSCCQAFEVSQLHMEVVSESKMLSMQSSKCSMSTEQWWR